MAARWKRAPEWLAQFWRSRVLEMGLGPTQGVRAGGVAHIQLRGFAAADAAQFREVTPSAPEQPLLSLMVCTQPPFARKVHKTLLPYRHAARSTREAPPVCSATVHVRRNGGSCCRVKRRDTRPSPRTLRSRASQRGAPEPRGQGDYDKGPRGLSCRPLRQGLLQLGAQAPKPPSQMCWSVRVTRARALHRRPSPSRTSSSI
jgi:hypothetical protein